METHLPSTVVVQPPKPKNEKERLEEVLRLKIIYTPNEIGFDRITKLCLRIFGVPISIVSILDERVGWFKSCFGLNGTEAPRDVTFCTHAIANENHKVMVVENATLDPRFANNPFVTNDPHIRFYAGAPLVTSNGYALGTLCILDKKPRELTADQIVSLQDLANVVTEAIENRLLSLNEHHQKELQRLNAECLSSDMQVLVRGINLISEGLVIWNPFQQVVYTNQAFTKITGYTKEEAEKLPAFDFWTCPETDLAALHRLKILFGARQEGSVQIVSSRKDGKTYWNEIRITPNFDASFQLVNYFGVFSDITEKKILEMKATQSAVS